MMVPSATKGLSENLSSNLASWIIVTSDGVLIEWPQKDISRGVSVIVSGKPIQDLNHCLSLSINVITEISIPKIEDAKSVIISKSVSLGVSRSWDSNKSFILSSAFNGIWGIFAIEKII